MGMEVLIGNLRQQTLLYKKLRPAAEGLREKAERSPEDVLEVLRSSQGLIDSVSRLADERRILEETLKADLDLEAFNRSALAGKLPEPLLAAFDEAVEQLAKELRALLGTQQGVVEALEAQKRQTGEKFSEVSKGRTALKTYYMKDNEARFIDKKTR